VRRARWHNLHVRADVRGMPAGRYRLRVRAVTRKGRHLRASKRFNACRRRR